MKKMFLALALTAAAVPFTFAAQTANPPAQDSTASSSASKTAKKAHKKSAKKAVKKSGAAATPAGK